MPSTSLFPPRPGTGAHTDKSRGCLNTPLKKGCCALTCVVLVAVAVVVPVYIFVILPAQLMQQLKDGLAFYPCDVKICADAATNHECTVCHFISGLSDLATCAPMAGARAAPVASGIPGASERLGMEMSLKTNNAINIDIELDHLALVMTETGHKTASTDSTTTALDYVDGADGAAVACVLKSPTTLVKKSWSTLEFHCEIKADTGLQPLFGAFVQGTALPVETTYAASATTPIGTQTLEGTYESSSGSGRRLQSTGDTLSDLAECPALDTTSQVLNSGLAPPNGVGAVTSGYQCAMTGSDYYLSVLPSCAVTADAFKDDAVTAFLCCIVKSVDGITLMDPLFDAIGVNTTEIILANQLAAQQAGR